MIKKSKKQVVLLCCIGHTSMTHNFILNAASISLHSFKHGFVLINVRVNQRSNQECTTQKHWQLWVPEVNPGALEG